MRNDTMDYKSVYWIFNNLMEKKLAGSTSTSDDKQIAAMYHLFMKRVAGNQDTTAELYKNAIKSDEETLKAWGLIY